MESNKSTSAVEVLRDALECYEQFKSHGRKCLDTNNVERIPVPYNEFKEALLALENQKEIICYRLDCKSCINQNCTRGKCARSNVTITSEGCMDFMKLKEVREVLQNGKQ